MTKHHPAIMETPTKPAFIGLAEAFKLMVEALVYMPNPVLGDLRFGFTFLMLVKRNLSRQAGSASWWALAFETGNTTPAWRRLRPWQAE